MTLANLSDQELIDSLSKVCFDSRRLLARLLLHLIEVEERRLHLRSACSSLFDFCRRRLGMHDGEAVRRIDAARLAKRFPTLLGAIERGDLNLTSLLLLRDHFTEANVDQLVAAAAGKTKFEIQEILAARAPKPDVLATITPLGPSSTPHLRPPEAVGPPPPDPAARVEPLAPARYRLELTIGAETRAKLDRARDLMGHRNPSRDLEAVLDRALDALLTKLEKERLGRTSHPTGRAPSSPSDVTPEVREKVFARDGQRCAFRAPNGDRCTSTTLLEIDHVVPRAMAGVAEPDNLRVLCRPHNLLHAEQCFGRAHVTAAIHHRQKRRAPPAPTSDDADAPTVAGRALANLGFRPADIRRALAHLAEHHAAAHLEAQLRAAIAFLT